MERTRESMREFMRREFGPDNQAKNEDGTQMTEEQLNEAADGWKEYFDAIDKTISRHNGEVR